MTPRNLTLLFASGVMIVTTGFVHGVMTHRWSTDDVHQIAAQQLRELPTEFGDWHSRNEQLSDQAVQFAELSGYVYRQYVNRRTRQSVTLLLMCGLPGPVSVHPPTACFQGAGFKQIGNTERVTVAGDTQSSPHRFRVADFEKPGSLSLEHPRIFWAWSTDGHWGSPESPRLEFAGSRILYKLYVTAETSSASSRATDPLLSEFLREILPHVHQVIAPK